MALEPKDIRELYTDFLNEWKEDREEGATDIKYLAGDPWNPKDRREREDAGRPCISLDELNQYINQYNNSLRQNKRSIQVVPKGSGARDADATNRENVIRGIEYQSQAQEAYITAGESAASRGMGYALLRTEYKDVNSEEEEAQDWMLDQKIVIQRVSNPDTILISPYFQRADASDIEEGFILRKIKKSEFADKFPDAEKKSFENEDMTLAPQWVGQKWLQIAEFWKVYYKRKKLLLVDVKGTLTPVWEEDLEAVTGIAKVDKKVVKRERVVEIPNVKQQLTNGVELLGEANEWAGSRIPIISCFGKEIWINEGGDTKRRFMSMVRLARDPQMLFAYLCTLEAEEAGLTPKTALMGYKGQFESSREQWEVINKQPFAFVELDIVSDVQNAGQTLPPPVRIPFIPNFQAYEVAKESVRRSIQAAMGLIPMPTSAQKDKEKSGVALERIENQENVGSFHFADNYDRFIQNMGWQVNELIKPIIDTQRDLMIAKADGTFGTLQATGNTSHPLDDNDQYEVRDLNEDHLHTGVGEFDVTISTGPSYQSQREQASQFVDHLISNWQALGLPPEVANRILALGVKLKGIGPIGDAIQDLLAPPDPNNLPPQAQAIVAQLNANIQQLTQENAALHEDRAGRVIEQQTKTFIAQLKEQGEMMRAQLQADLKAYIANVQTKAQDASERRTLFIETQQENQHKMQDHSHDIAMQKDQQAHESEIADKQAQAAQASQAMDQAHQSATQATEIANRPPVSTE